MNENPYASPQTYSQVSANLPVVPASQGKRFLNFFIDNIVVRVLATGAGFAFGLAIAASGATEETFDSPAVTIFSFLLGVMIAIGYFVVMEATTGRTIGKLLTGTKVVSIDGTPPTFGQVLGRSFARLIPFEPFSFLSKEAVGWHDTLSKTRVVKA